MFSTFFLKRHPAKQTTVVFASTAPAYASEVLPLQLRIYLTTYTNMYVINQTSFFFYYRRMQLVLTSSRCFIMGQLIASGVLKGPANNTTEWGYKIPFAIQVSTRSSSCPLSGSKCWLPLSSGRGLPCSFLSSASHPNHHGILFAEVDLTKQSTLFAAYRGSRRQSTQKLRWPLSYTPIISRKS